MSKELNGRHLRAFALPAILFAALPSPGVAKERVAAAVQRIQVYPDHYAAGGRRFVDLAALGDWVKATGTQSLELHTCMWTANERLVAAIEHFPNVYLDVRWITPGTLGCPSVSPDKAARAS